MLLLPSLPSRHFHALLPAEPKHRLFLLAQNLRALPQEFKQTHRPSQFRLRPQRPQPKLNPKPRRRTMKLFNAKTRIVLGQRSSMFLRPRTFVRMARPTCATQPLVYTETP